MEEKIRGSVKRSAEMACSILPVILSMKLNLMGIKVSVRRDTPQKTDFIYSAEARTTQNRFICMGLLTVGWAILVPHFFVEWNSLLGRR